MKIAKIETFLINAGWNNHCFVKVYTDEGLYGIGQAYSAGPDQAVVEVIRDFEAWLVGQDPFDIEHLWALMYNGTRFPPGVVVCGALSGIEHALWDIKGKALGVPVYQLLGGKCRNKVRVYQGVHDDSPKILGEKALELVQRYGYTALKISPQPTGYAAMSENALLRAAAERLEAVRRAVGPDVDIGVDPHARIFEPIRAVQMAEALKPYQPFFLEEPIRPENMDALALLRAKVSVPIATGESLYTKYQFRNLLVREAADFIQPDVCSVGGLLEMKKIAAMAEACYVTVMPHNPMGPVATAVNVHFAASTPNFVILEYTPDDASPRRDMVQEPMVLKGGYLELPTTPGLGIELDEEMLKKAPAGPWHRPFPFRADGSMAWI
jgi:galactonate dehydratase